MSRLQSRINEIREFFQTADSNRARNEAQRLSVLKSGAWSMHNGEVFSQTTALAVASRNLITGVLKLLGPTATNEKQINELAWDIAADPSPLKDKANNFIKSIQNKVARTYERIDPCFSVQLDAVAELRIGNVVVQKTDPLAKLLNKRDARWSVEVNSLPSFKLENSKFILSLPAHAWKVTVQGFKGNVRDQAAWQIDIALSLLRLSIPPSRRGSHFPNFGAVETSPISIPSWDDASVTLHNSTASFGGTSITSWYEISKQTFSKKQLAQLDKRGLQLMAPSVKTVGERLARGLGWLSRGRRFGDQPERFLYFFTAIEALLTNDDKAQPVTDTICRSAACILAKDMSKRAAIAKEMANLYEIRSKLIHGGDRSVSHVDSRDLQIRSELLFYRVLKKIDLNMSMTDFHASLKLAGYGSRWPR